MTLTITPACTQDLNSIFDTMRANRHDPSLFQQSRAKLARQLDEFLVARSSEGSGILGSLQVHRHPGGSVEILAVAVRPDRHGQGVGSALMRAAIVRARELVTSPVWLGTAKPGYFARLGFVEMSRWRLPLRVLVATYPVGENSAACEPSFFVVEENVALPVVVPALPPWTCKPPRPPSI